MHIQIETVRDYDEDGVTEKGEIIANADSIALVFPVEGETKRKLKFGEVYLNGQSDTGTLVTHKVYLELKALLLGR